MDPAGYQHYCEKIAKARRWAPVHLLFFLLATGGWFLFFESSKTATTEQEASDRQQATNTVHEAEEKPIGTNQNIVGVAPEVAVHTTTTPQVAHSSPTPDPFLAIPSNPNVGYYTWTRASDGYVIEAKVLTVENGRVTFRLRNGTTFEMPFNLLAKQDQLSAVQEAQKRKRGE